MRVLYRIFAITFFLFLYAFVAAECPRNEVNCTGKCGLFIDHDNDGYCDLGKQTEENKIQNVPTKSNQKKTYHHVLPIVAGFLGFYVISLILVKLNVYKKITHRKIWNVALAITFLISAVLSIMLIVFINNETLPDNYPHLLMHHVDFGIAMMVIAVFHISWHLNYFKTIFMKPDKTVKK